VLDFKYKTNRVNILQTKAAGASPFSEALYGLLRQQKWGISEKLIMVKRLDFGKTIG
jgi:hypothetical protein